jgi:hypothetical protein
MDMDMARALEGLEEDNKKHEGPASPTRRFGTIWYDCNEPDPDPDSNRNDATRKLRREISRELEVLLDIERVR